MNLEDTFKYSLLDFNKLNNNDYKLILVPEDSYLEDTRILQDFKNVTFGNHLKTEANKKFDTAILNCDIEKACYWAYQLLASGCINQLWDKCYTFIYKNINIQNPNAPIWILEKEKLYRKTVTNKLFSKNSILNTRNIQQIRNLLTELIAFICISNKRKIDTLNFKFGLSEFDLKTFYARLKYKDKIIIKPVLGPNDSKEIVLATNELFYAIQSKNIQEVLYWLTWINTWEKINIKKYKQFTVQARSIEGIDTQFQKDVIWLVWSVIQLYNSNHNNNTYSNIDNININKKNDNLNSLWLLYIFNWKPTQKQKKLPIIIWYISLLITPFNDFSIPPITNSKLYIKVISNVNLMFKKIKLQQINNNNNITSNFNISNNLPNNINILIENDNTYIDRTNSNTRKEIINNIKHKQKILDNTTQNKLDLMLQLDGYL